MKFESHSRRYQRGEISRFELLSLRLWLPLFLLLLVVLSRVHTYQVALEQDRLGVMAELQRDQILLAERLLTDIEYDMHELHETRKLPHLKRQLAFLKNTPELKVALLADEQGKVIAASHAEWIGRTATDVDPDARAAGTNGRTWVSSSRNDWVLSAYPVVFDGRSPTGVSQNRSGILFLAADPAPLLAVRTAYTRDGMHETNWMVALMAAVAWLLIHSLISRRIGRLMQAVNSFGSNRGGMPSGVSGRDEIGRLGAAFDQMVHLQESNALKARTLARAVEQSAASVIITDRQGLIEYVNAAFTQITGYTADEAIGKRTSMLSAGQTSPETYQELWQTINVGGTWRGEMLNRRKNGELYWDSVVISPVRDGTGEISHFVAVQEDISARKEAEDKLMLNMHILDSVSEAVAVTDAEQQFCYVNPAFTATTGYTAEEVIGNKPKLLSSGLMDQMFYENMWHEINSTGHWEGEILDRRKNGESYAEWLSISAMKDESGKVSRYVSVFTDISERKETERRVAHMARHDFLTGLPNRMLLLDRMAQAIAHARRDKRKIATMFLDLDRFKVINDTLGHLTGDKLLKEMAGRISRVSRASDTVCRLGGDEFVVMLTNLETVEDIAIIADKLLESVAGSCEIDGKEIEITTSIGISVFPDDGNDGEELLQRADAAMYHAKQRGRNNYQFFTDELNRRAQERLTIENKLRHALARSEFQLYYQPQVDRLSGRVVGAEALLRWNDLELGVVSPSQFIPIAEENGMIIPIGEWALREACRQNVAWRKMGLPEISVSVNLSTVQFRKGLGELISEILADCGLDPAGLELEITESALMDDTDDAIQLLYEIRKLGVKLAMDDFGTGYSSLFYLKRLPIDKLKIDQSFVRHMADDADDAVIVSTIINMARNLGLKHVAEGVETLEQMELLSLYGCDEMQGYYFGRPMPADEFVAYFTKKYHG